jgi:hypothetical protein
LILLLICPLPLNRQQKGYSKLPYKEKRMMLALEPKKLQQQKDRESSKEKGLEEEQKNRLKQDSGNNRERVLDDERKSRESKPPGQENLPGANNREKESKQQPNEQQEIRRLNSASGNKNVHRQLLGEQLPEQRPLEQRLLGQDLLL